MHRSVLFVGTLLTAQLLVATAAAARPRLENVQVRYGVVAELSGVGCTAATLHRALAGSAPLRFEPSLGEDVSEFDSIIVTAATLGEGRVSWTAQPTAEECEYYKEDPAWAWSTDERAWGVTHRARAHTIRASRHGGIRSIAGFRVDRLTRSSAPTIRRARRHFGKPSSLRRRYDVSCRARWKRLGLTIDFLNLGLSSPCRHGYLQAGYVKGPEAARWTAVVAGDPGVALGTTDAFLDSEFVGEPGETDQAWTLADVYIPYGEAGYYPSLSALLNPSGAVRGYEFWVGAGGD
jgi:hypothetical protein